MEDDFTEMDHGPIARLVAELRDKRPNGDFTLTTEEARKRVTRAFAEQHNTWLREGRLREGNTPEDETA